MSTKQFSKLVYGLALLPFVFVHAQFPFGDGSIPFNETIFYTPANESTIRSMPVYTFTQDNKAVIVPTNTWYTLFAVTDYPSKEVHAFVNESVPLNNISKAYHEYTNEIIDYIKRNNRTDDLMKRFFGDDPVRPSLWTILAIEFINMIRYDKDHNNCLCDDSDKRYVDDGNGVSEKSPWYWNCSPREKPYGGTFLFPDGRFDGKTTARDLVEAAHFNAGYAMRMFHAGVTGLLADEGAGRRMMGIKVPNMLAYQDEALMKIAGLPANASTTMLGAVKKLQYSLYQQIRTNRDNCPMKLVECGQNATDTCDDLSRDDASTIQGLPWIYSPDAKTVTANFTETRFY